MIVSGFSEKLNFKCVFIFFLSLCLSMLSKSPEGISVVCDKKLESLSFPCNSLVGVTNIDIVV